jgi:hypothetical protein
MKLELIKEDAFNDGITYSITMDGKHISGSYTRNLQTAETLYNKILQDPDFTKTRVEILKSAEISLSL